MLPGNTTCMLLNKQNCGKLHNEELHSLYSSPDITRVIKSRRIRWTTHGEMRNVYTILAVKPEGKRLFRRPRHR
jgi:hypothetical protein